ncbi:hypothetical protein P170DRAFT_425139 [Aspergillus steynii IBT 23096]|uniref:DUF7730 domain-containing protein n=1 Tax=Aspergillus steynii IBT 23096 TaxID=1392250 RepID=A0A2I2GD75_9EURO|nr:uncharacterized protein P170DRAFT_425139 [Aspergillus steynii IBT 23096]PLB50839.1 hypothetical protein P170DRAFT_425139 [Aspergillus steynii IBT 23096]
MAFIKHIVSRFTQKLYFGPKSDISKDVPKEREKNSPKPLPSLRPRTLTPPAGGDGKLSASFVQITTENEKEGSKEQQYVCDQSQSNLLQKLPVEVRLQIWRYCVALFDIHIVRGRNKLVAIPCIGRKEQARLPPCQHKCWGSSTKALWGYYGVCPGYYIGSNGCFHLPDPIPLLQSCRMIYSEAINLLYRENSFRVNHIDTIISLSHTFLPSRLNLIRTLHLAHSFPLAMYADRDQGILPYDANTWERVCEIIGNMTGLRELHIHLGGHHLSFELHEILQSLHRIRQVDRFEVFVGIGRDPETVYTVDRPFRFVSQHYDLLPDWECC